MASNHEADLTEEELKKLLSETHSAEQEEEPAPGSPSAEGEPEESSDQANLDQGAVDVLLAQMSEETSEAQADSPDANFAPPDQPDTPDTAEAGSVLLDQAAIEALFADAQEQAQEREPAPRERLEPDSPTAKTPSSPPSFPSEPSSVTLQPAQFSPLASAAHERRSESKISDIGILLDVPLRISVELGRAEMPVREVLELGPGSVIELDRSAGEVLDVLVNGVPIAHGEVVVVGEQFGIRLVRVLTASSRELLQSATGS